MAKSRLRAEWAQTSEVLAMLANANRDQKKKPSPFKSSDFNPFAQKWKHGIPITRDNIHLLKVFVRGASK